MLGSGTNGGVTCHDYNLFVPHSSSHLLPLSSQHLSPHHGQYSNGSSLPFWSHLESSTHAGIKRIVDEEMLYFIWWFCCSWDILWQRCQQTQLLDTQFKTVRQQNTSSSYKLSNWPHFIWESLTQWLATWHMIHDQVAGKGEKCKFWAWLLCNKLRVERSRKERPHFGLYKDTELIKSCETVEWRSGPEPESKRKENIDDQSWS